MDAIIEELERHVKALIKQEDNEAMELIKEDALKRVDSEINKRLKERGEFKDSKVVEIPEDIYDELAANPEKFAGMTPDVKDEITKKSLKQVQDANPERTFVIQNLKGLIEYLKLDDEQLFLEIENMSKAFQYINLHVNSQIAIFMHIMKINHRLNSDFDEPIFLPDVNKMFKHDFKYIEVDEVRKLFEEHRFFDFISSKSLKKRKARVELKQCFEEVKIDFTDYQIASNILGEIFEKDIKEVTDEDCQTIVEKMEQIHFGHIAYRVVKIIKKEQEIEKDNEIKASKEITIKPKKKEKVEPKFKARKVNQVHYEINKLYDLENFKSRTTLSLDEIIYLLSLMYSIEMDTDIITRFLSSVSHEYHKNSPFAIYYQSKEKYETSDNEEVSAHLEMIEYIMSDFDIFSCSDEKYIEVKSMISEEITAIRQILDGNYTYEIDSAKKLLKQNEE